MGEVNSYLALEAHVSGSKDCGKIRREAICPYQLPYSTLPIASAFIDPQVSRAPQHRNLLLLPYVLLPQCPSFHFANMIS